MGERDDNNGEDVELVRRSETTTIGGQIKQQNDVIDCEDDEKMKIRTVCVCVYGGSCNWSDNAGSV